MTSSSAAALVDTHAHIAPLSFLKEVHKSARAFGVEVTEAAGGYALTFPNIPPLRPANGNLIQTQGRLPWMDQMGIASQHMGIWLDIQGYSLPADKEQSWVHLLNEHLAQAARDGGERFQAVAAVPVRNGQHAERELEYAVNTLGMTGAMLASDPVDVDLADPGFEPFWAAAEALNVPVLLHGATHSKWGRVGPPYLGFSLGRTFDTTVLVAKLLLGGLLDRYPRLKLMLCHGGGFLPYQIGRIQYGYTRGTDKVADLQRDGPEAYMPMLYYDTVTLNARSLALLLDLVGSSHIMVGSDFVWDPVSGPLLTAVEALHPDAQQLADICCNTAQSLFSR